VDRDWAAAAMGIFWKENVSKGKERGETKEAGDPGKKRKIATTAKITEINQGKRKWMALL